FFNTPPSNQISTLSLHDALPIWRVRGIPRNRAEIRIRMPTSRLRQVEYTRGEPKHKYRLSPLPCRRRIARHCGSHSGGKFARNRDRKSTRLNSSHDQISYAVFCL